MTERGQAFTPTYPKHWEADVVLRDGSTMRIRPILPGDSDALQAFHVGQSEQSRYFRFFSPLATLSAIDLHRFTHTDNIDRVALVLVEGQDIIAVGRYDRVIGDRNYPGDDVAEIAFNVSDHAQGRGLGSVLLEHLAAAGREKGIRKFIADVLPANTRMLRVFSDAGYDVQQQLEDGVVTVNFRIRPTDRSMEVLAERERRAESLSMQRILGATSVLFYGSGAEGTALVDGAHTRATSADFTGPVHRAGTLADLRGLADSLVGSPADPLAETGDHPREQIDLAVIGALAAEVLQIIPVLKECGVGAILVLTGGFATVPDDDGVPQQDLRRAVRTAGMRLVGPRSYGVLARGAAGSLPVLLTPTPPRAADRGIGIFCQSATGARAMLTGAADRNLPLSTVLAAGHRADVSGNDTMQFWTSDEHTQVACVHLESIGNPRKFSRVARRLARDQPVIATIAGRSGQVRPPGHPVRETHAPRRALEELMNQAGVLQARSIRQQLDWAMAFVSQPLPAGDRVAVLTNSGTHMVILAELLVGNGARVTAGVPTLNPVATSAEYATVLTALAERDDWDAAIIAYGPFLQDDSAAVSAQIADFARATGRTVLAHVHETTGLHPRLSNEDPTGSLPPVQVPGFDSGEDAVAAYAAMRSYAIRRDTGTSPRVDPAGIDRRRADALLQTAMTDVREGQTLRLGPEETTELLASYGLPVLASTTVTALDEGIAAAETIGWPVTLKTSDEVLRHRADLGGVRLDLNSVADLRLAYETMSARLAALGRPAEAFEIQAMAATGAACVIVAAEDPLYGPIMSFGLGGDAIELLEDVSYRVPPLTEADASALVTSVKAAPRLIGHRDLPALDVAGLTDAIGRLSVLKEELAQVMRVELNPILVAEGAVAIITATVDLAHPARGDISRRVLPD